MKDLKHRAVKSIFWVTLANIIGKIIATVAILVLARQLDPADFGIYSIITTIISICLIIVSFGFDLWYVRAQDRERERYALFVKVSLLSILIISIVLFASAGIVSNFYNTSMLKPMIRYLSVYFLMGGSIQLFYQYLAKHLDFQKTSIAAVVRQIAQAIFAMSLAFYLHNAYALFWGYIAGGIVEFIILLTRVNKDFIRAIRDFNKVSIRNGIKTHWKFTGSTVSSQLVNVAARLTPAPILGKTLGFSATGLYTTMDNTITTPIGMIIGSVTATSLSILSKVPRNNLSQVSLKIAQLILRLSLPFFILLWIFTEEIIYILLGPEWVEGAIILRLIMIPIFLSVTVSPISQNFIILNKPHWFLYWNVALLIGNVIALMIGSLSGSLTNTIIIFTIFNIAMRLYVQILLARVLNINDLSFLRLYFKDIWQWLWLVIVSYTLKNFLTTSQLLIIYLLLAISLYFLIQIKLQKKLYQDLLKNIF